MSTYSQKLYDRTVGSKTTDKGFEESLKKRFQSGSVSAGMSIFKQLKIMCDVKGTSWTQIIDDFTAYKKTDPDGYTKFVAGFIQDFIDFSFSPRPCVKCYWGKIGGWRGSRCPECQDTKQLRGVQAVTLPNMISWVKKPMRYYGLLDGIANEDLRDKIMFPTVEEEEPEPLTTEFLKAILNEIGGKRKLYWWFVGTCGVRGSEGVQILPSDCKFVDEEMMPVPTGQPYFRIKITLRSKTTKTKKKRDIFVAKEIEQQIETLIKNTPDGNFLFREDGTSVANTRDYNNQLFRQTCNELAKKNPALYGILGMKKKSGTHKFTFHSMRSFAVTMLNRVDYGFGHALAGHKLYMGMYNRLTVEQKKEYLQKSDEYLAIFTDAKALSAKDRKIKELEDDAKRRKTYYEDQTNKINARLIKLENKM